MSKVMRGKKQLGRILEILTELKKRLLSRYPKRIKSVILFGSRARGENCRHSDTDLLILVRRLDSKTRDRIWDMTWDIDEENDCRFVLSPLVWDETFFKTLLKEERRIAKDIKKEGIRI